MKVALIVLVILGCMSASINSSDIPIENVVVLMMENRSFDHMLGWLHEVNPEIDGLTGTEWNSINSADPNSERIYVNKYGYDESPSDPNHGLDDTTEQIYGFAKPMNQPAIPKMTGFVQNAYESNLNTTTVMSMFTKEYDSAPILNHLALEFTVFDKWYASIPGPVSIIISFFEYVNVYLFIGFRLILIGLMLCLVLLMVLILILMCRIVIDYINRLH